MANAQAIRPKASRREVVSGIWWVPQSGGLHGPRVIGYWHIWWVEAIIVPVGGVMGFVAMSRGARLWITVRLVFWA